MKHLDPFFRSLLVCWPQERVAALVLAEQLDQPYRGMMEKLYGLWRVRPDAEALEIVRAFWTTSALADLGVEPDERASVISGKVFYCANNAKGEAQWSVRYAVPQRGGSCFKKEFRGWKLVMADHIPMDQMPDPVVRGMAGAIITHRCRFKGWIESGVAAIPNNL